MSLKRRVKRAEDSSSVELEQMYVLWKEGNIYIDNPRKVSYTKSVVDDLESRGNRVLIASWSD